MSYTFVKVTTYYPRYLSTVYGRDRALRDRTYDEQHQALMAGAFAWSDHYARNLRALGVDAHEIVGNALEAQAAWMRERGLPPGNSMLDVVLHQLRALKPEVVLVDDCHEFPGAWVAALKREVPTVRQVVGYICAPYDATVMSGLTAFDYVLSCHPGFIEDFRANGMKSQRLNHAFEATLIPKLAMDNPFPEEDSLFVGSIVLGRQFHNTRCHTLELLLREGVDVAMYGSLSAGPVGLRLDKLLTRKRFSPELRRRVQPPLFGLEMFKALSRARTTFNSHIDASGDIAANMRLFEATGSGSCLVTDHKRNIREFFEPDSEIVTYVSPEDCVEKVRWLLANPGRRRAIAAAGQGRVQREHTYAHRARELDAIIRANLRGAPAV